MNLYRKELEEFQNNRSVTINSMFYECSAVHLHSNALQVIRVRGALVFGICSEVAQFFSESENCPQLHRSFGILSRIFRSCAEVSDFVYCFEQGPKDF